MRVLAIALVLVGCGGKTGGDGTAPGDVASVFPAARFVPAQPTYLVSARTFREGQAAFTQFLDMAGMTLGFELSEASREFTQILGVDPLSPDAVAAIGVDLDGSMALFSDDLNPTFVLHLKSADSMSSFLDGQRQRGLRTQSVISDGVEVYSAKISGGLHIGWAIENDWLWVHFALEGADGVGWFENSHQPDGVGWVDHWKWAAKKASAVAGVLDLQSLFMKIGKRERDALACGKQFLAVKRVGMTFDAEPKRFGAQLAFDLGGDAQRLRAQTLPAPVGWEAASTNAPLAAQWNVDLPSATEWLEVCTGDDDFRVAVRELGIRSFRAFLFHLDIDDKEAKGAVAADLSSARYMREMLDQIPGRSMAESNKTFGAYKGKHVSIPFFAKGDYVLSDTLAIAAMGDGVMQTIGTGTATPPPVMAIDVRPQGMPAGTWQTIFEVLGADQPKRLVQRLMLWQELHVGAALDGSSLVIDAHGIRR